MISVVFLIFLLSMATQKTICHHWLYCRAEYPVMTHSITKRILTHVAWMFHYHRLLLSAAVIRVPFSSQLSFSLAQKGQSN